MNSYYIVSVLSKDNEDLDLAELALKEFNSTGVEEFSLDEATVDEILGERSYSGGDLPESVLDEVNTKAKDYSELYKFYFSNKEDAGSFLFEVSNHSLNAKLTEHTQEDWNQEWKKHYKQIVVNDELIIAPEWEKDVESKHVLYIQPGMGFGTGSHETTFLCLKKYLELPNAKDKIQVLDFGSGSGILGLATLLLNKENQVALYDIDPEAMINADQNIAINNMQNLNIVKVLPNNRDQIEKEYDLVFANILQNILELEKDNLKKSIKKDGYIILSGLLKDQVDETKNSYQQLGLSFVDSEIKGDWGVLVFKK
jgi:ribosomal protein L11 methyltransferase